MSINAENMNCDKLQQLEKDLRDMEVAYDELVEKYERTKEINEELNEQLTCSKKDCERWRNEYYSNREVLDNKINDCMAFCIERDKLAEENRDLRFKLEKTHDFDWWKNKVNQLKGELQEQKDRYLELEKDFDKIQNHHHEKNKFDADTFAELTIDCEKLRNLNKSLNDTNNVLKKELNDKIDDWMDVCEERDKYKELNLNLQRDLQEQKDDYTELSKEFSDLLNISTKDFGEMLVDSLAETDAKKIKNYILDIVDRAVAKMPGKED